MITYLKYVLFLMTSMALFIGMTGCEYQEILELTVTPETSVIALGDTVQLTATITNLTDPDNPSDITGNTSWTSDNACATVDENGLVTASDSQTGTAVITANFTWKTAEAVVVVQDSGLHVESITIEPESATINAGDTRQYTAMATYEDQSTRDVTSMAVWASSDSDVATIDSNGLALGVNDGVATITATLDNVTSQDAELTVEDPMTGLSISPESASLHLTDTLQYSATAEYASGDNADVTTQVSWSSSDTQVATIDGNGLATANSESGGTTAITAAMDGMTSNAATLTVLEKSVTSLLISNGTTTLDVAATTSFTATATYSDGSTADMTESVTWSSSNTAVAIINAAGLATGVNDGTADITATLDTVTSNTITLTVNDPLAGLTIDPVNASIYPGESQQYTATATYASGDTDDVTTDVAWDSSDPSVATIDSGGLATASDSVVGTTTITASKDGLTSNPATLSVIEKVVESIDIFADATTIDADESTQFTAIASYNDGSTADMTDAVTWTSGNTAVATIDSQGLASGVNDGTTEITATLAGITSNTVILTVEDPVLSLDITPVTAAIYLDETQQYAATAHFASGDTQNVTSSASWASSNVSVASIDSNGLATAGTTTGTTTITAGWDGVSGNPASLTVNPKVVVSLGISTATTALSVGDSTAFTATATYHDSTTADVTGSVAWYSSQTSVATISAGGVATAVNDGTTDISATLDAVTSNTVTLTVDDPLVSIDIAPDAVTLDIVSGPDTQQLTATGTYASGDTMDLGSQVSWSSSNTGVVSIDANGLATGLAQGTADITAGLSGIISDTATITVNASVALPVLDSISLFRGGTSANTRMDFWDIAAQDGGVVVSYAPETPEYYAYVAGFDQVTVNVDADNADTVTVNNQAVSNGADTVITFPAKGINTIAVSAENADGITTCNVHVLFLDIDYVVYGLYANYMRSTKIDKWFGINVSPDNGDELTIAGNVSGDMYWKISNSYTIDCDDTLGDDAAEYFGDDGSLYCGSSGLVGAFNYNKMTNYNDGNAYYSGTQDGSFWESDWQGPANEGGMTMVGDTVGDIVQVAARNGALRGRIDYYLDGKLILITYMHHLIQGGDIVESDETYTDYIYMPASPTDVDCTEGGQWCEKDRIILDYEAESPW